MSPTKVDLYSFDSNYLQRLQDGDGATQEHFASYFDGLLRSKLRRARVPGQEIDDLIHDTLERVLTKVKNGKIRKAGALGAYVNSVGENVLHEYWRGRLKDMHTDGLDGVDVADPRPDMESLMNLEECRDAMLEVVQGLPAKDRDLFLALIAARSKDQICDDLDISRDYLRVCLHRTTQKVKERYLARMTTKKK